MNAMKGETPLVVGEGDERRDLVLVLDHEALIEAEGAYGKPLPMLMADASNGFFGASRAMLFGALRAKHPEITRGDAAKLLLEHGERVAAALAVAAEAAFPKPEGGGDGARPRGTSSGSNGAKPGSNPRPSSAPRRGSSRSSSGEG